MLAWPPVSSLLSGLRRAVPGPAWRAPELELVASPVGFDSSRSQKWALYGLTLPWPTDQT
jgi:hypothetical protein